LIHLDTSFLVDLLRETARRAPGRASSLLAEVEAEELAASVHVLCELYAGAERSRRPAEEQSRLDRLAGGLTIVYPDLRFPRTYGRLLRALEQAGERIGVMDLLIATSAVDAKAALVTRNEREFSRVPGLRVITY
jgi:tRNA(fMet)-specific endonuclease VapC